MIVRAGAVGPPCPPARRLGSALKLSAEDAAIASAIEARLKAPMGFLNEK